MIDYKHIRYQSQKPKKSWGMKITALLILITVALIPFTYQYIKSGGIQIIPPIDEVAKSNKEVPLTEKVSPDRFTYFEILAKGEKVIQEKEILKTDIPSSKIYIQLAAFKTAAEADNFQTQIKLLDLSPKVESLVLPDKGGEWFIVRLGAVETDEEMARLKLILDSNQVKFAVVTKQ